MDGQEEFAKAADQITAELPSHREGPSSDEPPAPAPAAEEYPILTRRQRIKKEKEENNRRKEDRRHIMPSRETLRRGRPRAVDGKKEKRDQRRETQKRGQISTKDGIPGARNREAIDANTKTMPTSGPSEVSTADRDKPTRSRFPSTSSRASTTFPKEKITRRLTHGKTPRRSDASDIAPTEKVTEAAAPRHVPTQPKSSNRKGGIPGWSPPGLDTPMQNREEADDVPLLPRAMSKAASFREVSKP